MNRLMLAALCLGICIPHHVLLANWDIYSPSENESYSTTATVACDGEGEEEASYQVEIRINGLVEQSANGTTDEEGFWDKELEPNGEWTASCDGRVELWHNGQKEAEHAIHFGFTHEGCEC